MNKCTAFGILIFFVLSCKFHSAQANHANSTVYQHAKDIFQSSLYYSIDSNPEGSLITYIERLDEGQRLMLLNLQEDSLQILLNDSTGEINHYNWIDNDTIVINKTNESYQQSLSQLSLNFIDNRLNDIYQRPLITDAIVVDTLPYKEDRVLVKQFLEKKSYLYNLNLSARNISGQLRNRYKLNRLAPNAEHWLSDTSGKLRVGFSSPRHRATMVWFRPDESKRWKLIWKGKKHSTFRPILFDDKNDQLMVLSNHDRDFVELLKFDIASQSFTDVLLRIPGYDIESVELNKKRDGILFASYTQDGNHRRHYMNELGDFLSESLKRDLNTPNIWVVDSSLNDKIVIALKRDGKNPGIFYLFDTRKWELTEFADTQPWLSQFQLGDTLAISSKSSDGLEIESYLTLPANYKKVKAPLIVMPHGGPISVRSSADYDPHVQFLASLGYAVLRPNFRGSSGYGQKFIEAGKQQWGKLIEDDIESAVREVIHQGLVNGDKVCIYGSSYGGYSALMSAIRSPELFKCAASYVGVTDISLMYNNDANNSESILKWRKDFVGDPQQQQEELAKHSPVYLAEKLQVPIFLAQGELDRVVDKEHFYRMRHVLEEHDKEAQYLLLPEEVHGFSRLQSYYELYSHLDDFFRKHLNLPAAKPLAAKPVLEKLPTAEDYESLN
ncbi:prolyl oligopeptidase family serine peptidase [uncultured Pseudoteredinibacter sp.]|uniref:alpha/beta hydrolase family protein n=1 Tax=uncultured Pseudoteredinibacter sp. TaxID=1641701 RepID=UPI00263090FA|nr:prolyl oligopeptidase family serine peptidase [uncultured Pseudoteredinibacter sp.]